MTRTRTAGPTRGAFGRAGRGARSVRHLGLLAMTLLTTSCDDGAAITPDGGAMADGAGPAPQAFTHERLVDGQEVPLRFGGGDLRFDAPPDTLSLTVIVHGSPQGWYGIDAWTDPTGAELVISDWVTVDGNERGCFSCPVFTTQGEGASTTIHPNRPDVAVHPGTHALTVVGFVDGVAAPSARVTVIAKRGPERPSTGVIDLHFYFTGAHGWSAATVPDDSYFTAVVARFDAVFEAAGIRAGRMTFRDLDPSLQTVSLAPGDDSLGALVANSTDALGTGAHIFFVDEILTDDPTAPSIPGVAAAVPNPPLLPGTYASGIAIATRGPLEVPPADRFLDPPAIGQTLCHEMGHLLGLFHTSEYDGTSHDHFADTPDNDDRYLMHPDGTGALISPHQADAILANPVVRHPD